jgi:hypothetical protein
MKLTFGIFIILHALDGRPVSINPEAITSLQHKTKEKNQMVSEKAQCIVNLADGKFIAVLEDCDFVAGSIKP